MGREFTPGVDYIVVLNYLRQIGVYANLAFTTHREARRFASLDEAVTGLSWMVHDITDTEQDRLRTYLDATLVRTEGAVSAPRAHRALGRLVVGQGGRMRILLTFRLLAVSVALLAACAAPLQAMDITDMADRAVTIPDTSTKVFCSSPPACSYSTPWTRAWQPV